MCSRCCISQFSVEVITNIVHSSKLRSREVSNLINCSLWKVICTEIFWHQVQCLVFPLPFLCLDPMECAVEKDWDIIQGAFILKWPKLLAVEFVSSPLWKSLSVHPDSTEPVRDIRKLSLWLCVGGKGNRGKVTFMEHHLLAGYRAKCFTCNFF